MQRMPPSYDGTARLRPARRCAGRGLARGEAAVQTRPVPKLPRPRPETRHHRRPGNPGLRHRPRQCRLPRPRGWLLSSNDFLAGKRPARMRPSPPWDSRAETSRCRHAARYSSWVQFSTRAPQQAVRWNHAGWGLQCSGEVGQLGGHVPARCCGVLGGGHQAAPPPRSTPNTAS
jgi:hypothetical protein